MRPVPDLDGPAHGGRSQKVTGDTYIQQHQCSVTTRNPGRGGFVGEYTGPRSLCFGGTHRPGRTGPGRIARFHHHGNPHRQKFDRYQPVEKRELRRCASFLVSAAYREYALLLKIRVPCISSFMNRLPISSFSTGCYNRVDLKGARHALRKMRQHVEAGVDQNVEPAENEQWKSGRKRAITVCFYLWSGREDLNLRHLAPKASALPGCATPRT